MIQKTQIMIEKEELKPKIKRSLKSKNPNPNYKLIHKMTKK